MSADFTSKPSEDGITALFICELSLFKGPNEHGQLTAQLKSLELILSVAFGNLLLLTLNMTSKEVPLPVKQAIIWLKYSKQTNQQDSDINYLVHF